MAIKKAVEGDGTWSEMAPGVWETLEGLAFRVPRQMQVVEATLASLETWGLELALLEPVARVEDLVPGSEFVYILHYQPNDLKEEWLGMAGYNSAPGSVHLGHQAGHQSAPAQEAVVTLLLGRGDYERVAEFGGVARFKRPCPEAMMFPQEGRWAQVPVGTWLGSGVGRVYRLCLRDRYHSEKGLELGPDGLYLPMGSGVGKRLGAFEEIMSRSMQE